MEGGLVNEEKIGAVRERLAGILGGSPNRVLFVEDTTYPHIVPVHGQCSTTGFITVTVTPDADENLTVYAVLHELGHRQQFAAGMSLADYRRDFVHYELDAWTRADGWLASAEVTKTFEMTAFAEICLSSYRSATQYTSMKDWNETP